MALKPRRSVTGAAAGPAATLWAALASRDCEPRGTAARFSAACPAHRDDGGDLTVVEAAGGRVVLVNCRGECPTGRVLAALDLDWSDLAAEKTS
jgi:hypothetical protein